MAVATKKPVGGFTYQLTLSEAEFAALRQYLLEEEWPSHDPDEERHLNHLYAVMTDLLEA